MRYFNSVTGQYEDDGMPEFQRSTIDVSGGAYDPSRPKLELPMDGLPGRDKLERQNFKTMQTDMSEHPELYPFGDMAFTNAEGPTQQVPEKQEMNPIVKQHIAKLVEAKKRGVAGNTPSMGNEQASSSNPMSDALPAAPKAPSFMDKYSDAEYKKAQDASREDNGSLAIAQLFGGIGDAIAGRSSDGTAKQFANYRQQIKDNTVGEFDRSKKNAIENYSTKRALDQDKLTDSQRAREMDVNSEESKMRQDFAIKMGMKPETARKMSAFQLKEVSPVMEKMYAVEQAKLARQDASADRRELKDTKKKTLLNEVEDRRSNIEDNITRLESMIKENGTYEMFGSHNTDMDRLVDQIATDMAKLTDPNSVARPSEVEMFKKGLIQSNAASMRNSTALNILHNFRGEVNKRAENAYSIRGLDNPGSQADKNPKAQPDTVVQNGHTYTLNKKTGKYE